MNPEDTLIDKGSRYPAITMRSTVDDHAIETLDAINSAEYLSKQACQDTE